MPFVQEYEAETNLRQVEVTSVTFLVKFKALFLPETEKKMYISEKLLFQKIE